MITHFSKFGYSCPANFNPADYMMSISQTESMETLEAAGVFQANAADAALIVSQMEVAMKNNIKDSELPLVQAAFHWVSCGYNFHFLYILTSSPLLANGYIGLS